MNIFKPHQLTQAELLSIGISSRAQHNFLESVDMVNDRRRRNNLSRSMPTIMPIAKAGDVKTEGTSNPVHSATLYPESGRETTGTEDRYPSAQFISKTAPSLSDPNREAIEGHGDAAEPAEPAEAPSTRPHKFEPFDEEPFIPEPRVC